MSFLRVFLHSFYQIIFMGSGISYTSWSLSNIFGSSSFLLKEYVIMQHTVLESRKLEAPVLPIAIYILFFYSVMAHKNLCLVFKYEFHNIYPPLVNTYRLE